MHYSRSACKNVGEVLLGSISSFSIDPLCGCLSQNNFKKKGNAMNPWALEPAGEGLDSASGWREAKGSEEPSIPLARRRSKSGVSWALRPEFHRK